MFNASIHNLFGITVVSFISVCLYRAQSYIFGLPKSEQLVKGRQSNSGTTGYEEGLCLSRRHSNFVHRDARQN